MKKNLRILVVFLNIFISNNLTAQTQFEEYKFNGTIGSRQIVLTFLEPDHFFNQFEGFYFYTKYNQNIEFKGEEGVFDGSIKLTESINGKNTGYFIFENLDYSKNKLFGKWYNMDRSQSFDVVLTKN